MIQASHTPTCGRVLSLLTQDWLDLPFVESEVQSCGGSVTPTDIAPCAPLSPSSPHSQALVVKMLG